MHSIMQQGFLHDIPMTHSSFAQIELEGSWIHMEVSLQNQLHNVLHLQHKVSEKCQITNFLDISQLSTINQFVYYPTNQSISYPAHLVTKANLPSRSIGQLMSPRECDQTFRHFHWHLKNWFIYAFYHHPMTRHQLMELKNCMLRSF